MAPVGLPRGHQSFGRLTNSVTGPIRRDREEGSLLGGVAVAEGAEVEEAEVEEAGGEEGTMHGVSTDILMTLFDALRQLPSQISARSANAEQAAARAEGDQVDGRRPCTVNSTPPPCGSGSKQRDAADGIQCRTGSKQRDGIQAQRAEVAAFGLRAEDWSCGMGQRAEAGGRGGPVGTTARCAHSRARRRRHEVRRYL